MFKEKRAACLCGEGPSLHGCVYVNGTMGMNLRYQLLQFSNLNLETILNPSMTNGVYPLTSGQRERISLVLPVLIELRNIYTGHSCTRFKLALWKAYLLRHNSRAAQCCFCIGVNYLLMQ